MRLTSKYFYLIFSYETFKLLRLRNPWGKCRWKGSFSYNDPVWTEELMECMDKPPKDCGEFWMEYSDFCQNIEYFTVCHYHDGNNITTLKITWENNSIERNDNKFIRIKVSKPGLYYFTTNQKNKRGFLKSKRYRHSNCTMTIAKVINGKKEDKIEYHVMGTITGCEQDIWFNNFFEEGEYICSLHVHWNSTENSLVLGAYGPEKVEFNQLSKEEKPQNFFHKITYDYIEKFNNNDWQYLTTGRKARYKVEMSRQFSNGFCVYENLEEDAEWNINLTFLNHVGVKALAPNSFHGSTNLIVAPNSQESFIYFFTEKKSQITTNFTSSFINGINSVKKQCIEDGAKNERKRNGEHTGIFLHGLMHQNGVFWLYNNTSKDLIINETVTYIMSGNSSIENVFGNKVDIEVRPGQSNLVSIVYGKNSGKRDGNIKEVVFTEIKQQI